MEHYVEDKAGQRILPGDIVFRYQNPRTGAVKPTKDLFCFYKVKSLSSGKAVLVSSDNSMIKIKGSHLYVLPGIKPAVIPRLRDVTEISQAEIMNYASGEKVEAKDYAYEISRGKVTICQVVQMVTEKDEEGEYEEMHLRSLSASANPKISTRFSANNLVLIERADPRLAAEWADTLHSFRGGQNELHLSA